MKIHYFYKKDYRQGFYDLEIVAWLEEKTISRQGDERLSIIRTSNRLRSFFRNGYFWSKAIKTKRLLILQKYNSIQTPFY